MSVGAILGELSGALSFNMLDVKTSIAFPSLGVSENRGPHTWISVSLEFPFLRNPEGYRASSKDSSKISARGENPSRGVALRVASSASALRRRGGLG